ncbi:MAG: nicotinamidase [Phycisphaerae bacterium]|nr:nicotinamidase [Phycisphaerae bacterium]
MMLRLSMLGMIGLMFLSQTGGTAVSASKSDQIDIHLRSRVPSTDQPGAWRLIIRPEEWKPSETAVVICDMWDRHWCASASARVAELAGPMNEIVSMARSRGILIVHSPSECMSAYKDHPARKNAIAVTAGTVPDYLGKWNSRLDKEADWPVDQSDGGCDCATPCKQGNPWRKQIDAIFIDPKDIISDDGIQIGRLFEQRGIRHVIVMGVHTNMCVVGRPFGARNLARWGKDVVIMRDMTDTMYNPKMSPQVNHFTGTSVVLEHIEKYICPTIASTDLTGKPPFRFAADIRPKIVFVTAEHEYRADQRLPEFARLLENHYDLACDFAAGRAQSSGTGIHRIENLQTLADADLCVIAVRRRALPEDQMKIIREYLNSGKGIIGIRTASHAFNAKQDVPSPDGARDSSGKPILLSQWLKFDEEVLGCKYTGHYDKGPEGTKISLSPAAKTHPILAGLKTDGFVSPSWLYTNDLDPEITPLLIGTVEGKKPEPVAWTYGYKGGRVFYTSLGHWDDWKIDPFRAMMIRAVFWTMNKPIPPVTPEAGTQGN